MPDSVEACCSTRHCVNWGFCHRCAPDLAEEASRRYRAAAEGVPEAQWSEVYAGIVGALLPPVPDHDTLLAASEAQGWEQRDECAQGCHGQCRHRRAADELTALTEELGMYDQQQEQQ